MKKEINSISDLGKGPPASGYRPLYTTTGWRNDLHPAEGLDLRSFGAVFDGTTDNATAIDAAITAATALKAPIAAPGGTCAFTGQHIFPDYVGLVGCGSVSTVFKGLDANAQLRFNGSRVRYRGFSFDGNHIANTGIAFGFSNGMVVENVHATNCLDRGIWVSNVQNATFTNMQSSANDGHGVVIDNGTGSCVFLYCGGTGNRKHQLWITASDTEAEANPNPFYLQFVGGVWERVVLYDSGTATGGSGTTLVDTGKSWTTDQLKNAWVTMDPGGANQEGQPISGNTGTTITVGRTWSVNPGAGTTYRIHFPPIRLDASAGSIMRRTVVTAESGGVLPGQYPLIDMKRRGLTETATNMVFELAAVTGSNTSYHIGLDMEGVNVIATFDTKSIFGGLKTGINLVGGSALVENEFPFMSTNVITKYVGLTSRLNKPHYYVAEQNIYQATGDTVEIIQVVGDAGFRFRRKTDGLLEWMDGTSFSADTNLFRNAANELKTGDNFISALGVQSLAVARTATSDGLTTGTIADNTRVVTVTSADANNIIVLPTPTPGVEVTLFVGATGYELRSSSPTTIAINGGTGAAAESAIGANVMTTCKCVTSTKWLCADTSTAGVVTATQVAAP